MKGKYKRLIALLMAVLMMLAFAACGNNDQSADVQSTAQQEETPENTNTTSADTLVVYFSATGNTKEVAEKISEAAGTDIYEIVPAVPYSGEDLDYGDDTSRATSEQNDPDSRPEIGGEDIDLSNYSTVFIGYPIWFGQAPRIMDTFVESHDFDGKKVIPFCTSGSSDIGQTGDSLAEKAGKGDWQTGKRFAGGASEDEVRSWVESLGLQDE